MWKDNFDPTATATPEISIAMSGNDEPSVSAAIAEQFDQHEPLQQALIGSGLPRRFQAMVLGLAALKQMNGDR